MIETITKPFRARNSGQCLQLRRMPVDEKQNLDNLDTQWGCQNDKTLQTIRYPDWAIGRWVCKKD